MLYAICLGLFLPLLGFLILTAFSQNIGRALTGWIACSTVFISLISFAGLLYIYTSTGMAPVSYTLYNWVPVEKIEAGFTLHLDQLSLLMTLIITGVGFLIHVYSNGYIDHEEDYARFFACMNLFVFFMLLLVLAGHLLLLFVGWEGVGLASYLLIGYWYSRPAAAQAAKKAFVVNRIGDWGFLLGLLLIFQTFSTGNIAEISARVGQQFSNSDSLLSLIALLLFIGATGKSAQIPLHTWLPDAMEGPTPVSALIHAATMVTAGVYLIVRLNVLYTLTPEILWLVGIVGAVTSLFAAMSAVGQTDLKRVLAYSTVSQLGLMFLACGVGAYYAAMFHLTMHAFVKGLLFLAAGSVVHMMGSTDMEKMGGLSKKLPLTNWLFLIGVLALAGIPPLAAFWSKDLILDQAHLAGFNVLFYIGLFASILTAFYMMRAYCLAFTGQPRLDQKILNSVKEAPRIMLQPMIILALLSIFGGFLGYAFGTMPILQSFLEKAGITLAVPTDTFFTIETWMSIIGAFLGAAIGAWMYTRDYQRFGQKRLPLLQHAFYIDQLYWYALVVPVKALATMIADFFEPKVFDGAIRGTVHATQDIAINLQKIQSGQIRSYVAWMAVGMVILLAYFVL